MVVEILFKEDPAPESFRSVRGNDTQARRIVRFWLHQPRRLTDGHIAFHPDGTWRIAVNWSGKGKLSDIKMRAAYEFAARREEAGFVQWDDAKLRKLLASMQIETNDQPASAVFAETILKPIHAAERIAAQRLSIEWDVAERDTTDAIVLRYQVVQKAEAILNDAGLLVDQDGTVVSNDTVSATLEVSEFETAKSLLWTKLSPEERRYNCRIVQG